MIPKHLSCQNLNSTYTAKRQNLMQQCLFGLASVLELNNTKRIANMSISTILGTLSQKLNRWTSLKGYVKCLS